MMVGVEVRRFGLEQRVAEIARRMHVPVVGICLGLTAHPEVGQPGEESDCLLLFGVIVSDTSFGISEGRIDARRCVPAADRSVTMGFHRYGNVPLAALVDELIRRLSNQPLRSARRSTAYPRGLVADDAPITPLDVAKGVNGLFAGTGQRPVIIVGDGAFQMTGWDPIVLVISVVMASASRPAASSLRRSRWPRSGQGASSSSRS